MVPVVKLRGLVRLVRDAVDAGSTRIEQLQKESLAQPLAVLRVVPALERPAEVVEAVLGLSFTAMHAAIRAVNGVVATVLDAMLP